MNVLSDHDAQLLTIQFVQKHNKYPCTYFKRNINQHTIADFLLKLSYETWDSVFEGNDVNILFNSFYKLYILAIYRSPLVNFNTFITNFDLILRKFLNLKINFIICGDINVNYLAESYKKINSTVFYSTLISVASSIYLLE